MVAGDTAFGDEEETDKQGKAAERRQCPDGAGADRNRHRRDGKAKRTREERARLAEQTWWSR